MSNNFKMVKFVDNDFELEVKMDQTNETVWLTQKEMAKLFDVSDENIRLHISNIFKEKELDVSASKDSLVVQIEGKREIKRNIKIYNLDMIISVGYRVKAQMDY